MSLLNKNAKELLKMDIKTFYNLRELKPSVLEIYVKKEEDENSKSINLSYMNGGNLTLQILKEGFEKEDENKIILDCDNLDIECIDHEGRAYLLDNDSSRIGDISFKRLIIDDNTLINLII